jgi:ribosomal protein S1
VKSENAWHEAKIAYPVGSLISGRVKVRYPYGVFLEVEDLPEVTVFVDVVSYNPGNSASEPVQLPEVGEPVEGVVVQHVDRDRQVRVRVGIPFWDKQPNA